MLYDDGSKALFMPGQTQDFFVLSKYSDTFCSHFAAHFVRGGELDDHRPNSKRLRVILLLSGQRLGKILPCTKNFVTDENNFVMLSWQKVNCHG